MMGGVSPETCWASHKYGRIKVLIHCCILLDFLYESYFFSCEMQNFFQIKDYAKLYLSCTRSVSCPQSWHTTSGLITPGLENCMTFGQSFTTLYRLPLSHNLPGIWNTKSGVTSISKCMFVQYIRYAHFWETQIYCWWIESTTGYYTACSFVFFLLETR
jgi:hypothetical protein